MSKSTSADGAPRSSFVSCGHNYGRAREAPQAFYYPTMAESPKPTVALTTASIAWNCPPLKTWLT